MPSFDVGRIKAMIPTSVSSYMDTNMDTNLKEINHVLWVMFACNIFLLLGSFSTWGLPNIGFSSFFVAVLSCTQNVVIWAALNGKMPQRFSFLAKSAFALGCYLGISIGMAVIMSVLSRYFGQLLKCVEVDVPEEITQYACESKGGMRSYWFFAILLNLLNVLLAALLVKGKDDLMDDMGDNYQYDEIGTPMTSHV